jgi:hypothetical protein
MKAPISLIESNITFEPLMDTESSVMNHMGTPAVTSISFFTGEDVHFENSLEHLKDRIASICTANPWLAGKLVKNKKIHKNVLLAVPTEITSTDLDAILVSQEDSLSGISTSTPYTTLSKAVSKSNAMVKEGFNLIGKDLRVCKFTLLPVANGQVVFILSITHAVVDGFTYYKIMNMLTDGMEIEKLSFIRKHAFVPQMHEAMGKEECKLLFSPGLMLNFMPGMLFGPTARFDARFIDEEKVRAAKEEALCRGSEEIEYACSTNDIITTTFGNAAKAELLMMTINLRNRVTEATDNDAGNYETAILFDAASSAHPEAIRKTLRKGGPFTRVGGTPLPGFFKLIRARLALITNWVFPAFKADLQLRNANDEKTASAIHLHLPIYAAGVPFPIAVVFRPCFGKLAVLYMGTHRAISHDRLVASGAPIGDKVSDVMFAEA